MRMEKWRGRAMSNLNRVYLVCHNTRSSILISVTSASGYAARKRLTSDPPNG